jgi:hypothetical protein
VSKCIKRNSVSVALRKTVITGLSLIALIAVFDYAPISYLANNAHAETGIGKDVFKVVVSVFGANKETGDILTLVTNITSTQNDNIIEFVAAFPKVNVNPGDHYRSCVITPNTMHKYCKEGSNSPAKRPEFVDISLDKELKLAGSVEK